VGETYQKSQINGRKGKKRKLVFVSVLFMVDGVALTVEKNETEVTNIPYNKKVSACSTNQQICLLVQQTRVFFLNEANDTPCRLQPDLYL